MRKEIGAAMMVGKRSINKTAIVAGKVGSELGKTLKEGKSKKRTCKIVTYILCLCWLAFSEYLVAKKEEKAAEGGDEKIAA